MGAGMVAHSVCRATAEPQVVDSLRMGASTTKQALNQPCMDPATILELRSLGLYPPASTTITELASVPLPTITGDAADASLSTSVPSDLAHDDLTLRYVRGEITYREFSELMDPGSEEEGEDDLDWSSSSQQGPVLRQLETSHGSQSTIRLLDMKMEQEGAGVAGGPFEKGGFSYEEEKEEEYEKKMGQEQSQVAQKKSSEGKVRAGKGGVTRRKGRRLPPVLQGLLGEANLRFARGNSEEAITMCLEVVRQAPYAPESFQTLSMIYEEIGDAKQSLHHALIAAHLTDERSTEAAEEWARLGDLSVDQGDVEQAKDCYRRAAAADPSNADYHFMVANLLCQLDQRNAAFSFYKQIMLKRPCAQDPDVRFRTMREMARIQHDLGHKLQAREALESAFKEVPEAAGLGDVNLYCELLLEDKDYQVCLELLASRCRVRFEPALPFDPARKPDVHLPPTGLPVDLRVKLGLCLMALGWKESYQDILDPLMKEPSDNVADLFFDVGEGFTKRGLHHLAIPFFQKLLSSERFGSVCPSALVRYVSAAGAWLLYGKCLEECHRKQDAITAYAKVVHLVPEHAEARIALSRVQKDLGMTDEAITTLTQVEEGPMDEGLLYQRCNLLFAKEGRKTEFIDAAKLFLSRHFAEIKSLEDLDEILKCRLKPRGETSWWREKFQVNPSTEAIHLHSRGINVLSGNNALQAGAYKYALGDYFAVFRQDPSQPLLSLLIGTVYLVLAHQRRQDSRTARHTFIPQGLAFLNHYLEERGECQESQYNMGRAMLQIGLPHIALHYLKRALTLPPAVPGDPNLDMTQEIAFTISLLYQRAKNYDVARMYLIKYCTI
ncbi:unnamed protein product [Cyprideis torosa]|uniref:Uncharacterized protein n=1 Tax=Cyprideis torosa TaxID=163714 RepID=A0A7R8W3W2_9CRUS|nr:unnamed protein product [Cyprideis torosa]CAG0883453.1 unnamed protein product [Cyprideis torosa]